ncbi:Protein fem-1-like B [Stylophora pistillata]|uniref:Protein fem-1-like B n=1 Tax=Stylophora pistillata TaxID=50429 RepID=A0A2B4R5J3_STYPI|nr:Protein fem-1-like B [Stylophora pistillata]
MDTKTKDGDENATPLIIASRNGNLDCVKILLSFEADIEARGTVKANTDEAVEDCSPSWVAAATGHVVKLLIDHKEEVNGRNATNSTPLRVAAYDGRLDIVSYVVENGADVNSRDEFESTPLMITCYKGHMDVASYLILHGANHHLKDNNGDTCLHYAEEKGHIEVVGRLLSLGVKEEQNHKCLTPLLVASSELNLSHDKESQSADLEEQELDELYFDIATGKLRARREGNVDLQRP